MTLGKLDIYMQKNQTELLSHIIYKSKLKIDCRYKWKIWNYKIPGEKCAAHTVTLVLIVFFFRYVSSSKGEKSKNKQMEL